MVHGTLEVIVLIPTHARVLQNVAHVKIQPRAVRRILHMLEGSRHATMAHGGRKAIVQVPIHVKMELPAEIVRT